MSTVNLVILALALALDALAVAITTGMRLGRITPRHVFRLSFHFGLFQAIMPVMGWLAGLSVRELIESWDHWVAFGLLAFVGIKMIRESLSPGKAEEAESKDPTRGLTLLMLSLATSIDALAVGLSLSLLGVSIWIPAAVIGLVCLCLTALGMYAGHKAAELRCLGRRAGLAGGLVIMGIGLKILWEHGVFSFLS